MSLENINKEVDRKKYHLSNNSSEITKKWKEIGHVKKVYLTNIATKEKYPGEMQNCNNYNVQCKSI